VFFRAEIIILGALAIIAFSLMGVALAQTTSTQSPETGTSGTSDLPDKGAAPELTSLAFLNSDVPLRLANLRGQVVLVEFWTFGCINCIRTLPYLEQWHQTYQDQGLVTVGVHYPEFEYEHDLQNVRAGVERLNVTYPVAIDNDGQTWRSYSQRYWPTMYLIDKQGKIRYIHIGEGRYQETEQAIKDLLAETYTPPTSEPTTPEETLTYLTPNDVVNVRSAPGTENAQIGSINPGMSFIILSEHEGWYEISYNDGTGFVSGEFVTVAQK
jgi:thiol-disulfide isomerase/thioredoxin